MAWECAEGLTCMRCGEVGHLQRNCKNVSCHKCGQKGHISKYCTDPFVKAVEVEREEHRQLILAVRSGGLLGVAIGAGPGAARAFPGISNAPGLTIGQVPGGTGPWDGLGRGRGGGGIGGRSSWAVSRGRGFPVAAGVGGNTAGRGPPGGRWNSHSAPGRGERRAGDSTSTNKQGGGASDVSPSAPLASWAPSPLAQNSASQKALVAQRVRVVEKRAKRKHGEGGDAEGAERCRKREGCGEGTETGKDEEHQAGVMQERGEVAGASLRMEGGGDADGKVASDTRGPSLWEGLVAYGSDDDDDDDDDDDVDDDCDASRGELGDAVGGHSRDNDGSAEQNGKVQDDMNAGVCLKFCIGGNDATPATSRGPPELDAEWTPVNCVHEHEEPIGEAITGDRQIEREDLLGAAKEIQSPGTRSFGNERGVDVSPACAIRTNEGSACLRESTSAEVNSPPREDVDGKIAGEDLQPEALSANDSPCEKDARTVPEDEDTVSPDNPVKSGHDGADCRLGGVLVRSKKEAPPSSHCPSLNGQINGDAS
ncbi:hypothetical protein CBR_g36561 [Chara braunii]|uniref:CCHC-type domain-containing protein n=1 Tax=Chara braunii TaxID=69332 RepID=A0A388JZ70_CHABU|nr:hypothetical protein CBR_g36561 [Chara braunii]|eukprot:GBG63076.1 hypothetical protein CBR_g36561 [Chara braunii]